jgi:hypothetical protein
MDEARGASDVVLTEQLLDALLSDPVAAIRGIDDKARLEGLRGELDILMFLDGWCPELVAARELVHEKVEASCENTHYSD